MNLVQKNCEIQMTHSSILINNISNNNIEYIIDEASQRYMWLYRIIEIFIDHFGY